MFPSDIRIDNGSQYFLSLVSMMPHTFIVLGYIDKQNKAHVLCEVGKAVDPNQHNHCLSAKCHALFTQAGAYFQEEDIILRLKQGQEDDERKKSLTYVAYEIGLVQYCEFMSLLSHINPDIRAYVPRGNDSRQTTFAYKTVSDALSLGANKPVSPAFRQRCHSLSIFNTCRDTAKECLQQLYNFADECFHVPSAFYYHLPLNNHIQEGVFTKPLFLLPAPPTSFAMPQEKRSILFRLYHRLEVMSCRYQNNPFSLEKFNALKALYSARAGVPSESVTDFITHLYQWKKEHKKLIETHRGWSFFGLLSTATSDFFTEIEGQYIPQTSQINRF